MNVSVTLFIMVLANMSNATSPYEYRETSSPHPYTRTVIIRPPLDMSLSGEPFYGSQPSRLAGENTRFERFQRRDPNRSPYPYGGESSRSCLEKRSQYQPPSRPEYSRVRDDRDERSRKRHQQERDQEMISPKGQIQPLNSAFNWINNSGKRNWAGNTIADRRADIKSANPHLKGYQIEEKMTKSREVRYLSKFV
jgi:hypothetical protein